MQVLIMYYSRTGNTKKLAEEIVRGVREVEGVKCALKPVSEVTKDDFLQSDGIVAGSPVYFGTMAAELKSIFDKFIGTRSQMEDKIGAAFATSAHHTGRNYKDLHHRSIPDIWYDSGGRPSWCQWALWCCMHWNTRRENRTGCSKVRKKSCFVG